MPKKKLSSHLHDINKFPSKEGMIVFPISMSRIGNQSQNAKTYWEYIEHFNPSKIDKNNPKSKVGAMFLYCDFLYLYSDENSSILKSKFMNLVNHHRNSFQNIIKGHPHIILDSFSYKVWNQFYVDNDKFVHYLQEIKKIYKKDKKFQEYIEEDSSEQQRKGHKLDENQLNFFLEEHLMCYMISKGKLKLENDFIKGHEKWILLAYPGKPPKALVYIYQNNFFRFDCPDNKYQDSWYDLDEKKLYNYLEIDLDSYSP